MQTGVPNRKLQRSTATMFYLGAGLISLLSFFTTLAGLAIILPFWLAVVGSLGLQMAMLGIAWNLIGMTENRTAYSTVFLVAAAFSVFFSYVNFDSNLRVKTRAIEARQAYTQSARNWLATPARLAKDAEVTGRYQLDRLSDLIDLEEKEGWTTLVDEGSGDKFIQSVIDGARLTVDSWSKREGRTYRQGSGKGLVVNFLQSRQRQINNSIREITAYNRMVQELTMSLNGSHSTESQYALVNKAAAFFPVSDASLILGERVSVSAPPDPSAFAEKAENPQHELALVIDDLFILDRLTVFSLALAITIDLITLLIALAGGRSIKEFSSSDLMLERVESDARERVGRLSLDNPVGFDEKLEENLKRYSAAMSYREKLMRILSRRDSRIEHRVVPSAASSITMRKPAEADLTRSPRTHYLRTIDLADKPS